MEKFTRNLITEWRKLKLPFANETFVVAVSGGADSVALMLALEDLKRREKLNLRFVIAHFNHNLRGAESEADAEYIRRLTTEYNFEFVCKTQNSEIKIQNQTGNLEQNARQMRYEFLTETAGNLHAYVVLTAHTLNDQAETFLINLIRGSGLEGLGGMKPVRDLGFKIQDSRFEDESEILNPESRILLVRPLLNWAKREDTENFCRLKNIEFRLDTMNEDLAFSRVRIRKILLPLLKDFNPKIVETLAQTAGLLRESGEQLAVGSRQSAENTLSEVENTTDKDQRPNLLLKDLTDIFPAIRRFILRDWLKTNRGDTRRLELKHIEAIENLILSRKSGRVVELPGGETVLKKGGKLHFQKTKVEK